KRCRETSSPFSSIVNRVILAALNRCEVCGRPRQDHKKAGHPYSRDERLPEWRGWHAARHGLGSNLYRLGVPEKVIQRILRHANVSTTATYYIKTAADDVLERHGHSAKACTGSTSRGSGHRRDTKKQNDRRALDGAVTSK